MIGFNMAKKQRGNRKSTDHDTVKAAREILAGNKQKNRMARLLPFYLYGN
jgi:hypothetical protein